MTPQERRLLTILDACPNGCTLDALRQHKVTTKTIVALVTADFARVREESFAMPRGMIIARVLINESGRRALARNEERRVPVGPRPSHPAPKEIKP